MACWFGKYLVSFVRSFAWLVSFVGTVVILLGFAGAVAGLICYELILVFFNNISI